MARYSVPTPAGQVAVTSSAQTILHTLRGASTRAWLYDFTLSASGTPADNTLIWTALRGTTAITSTAVTANPLDTADPASVTTAGRTATIEPTLGGVLWNNALNQRATYRWVAAPGGELVQPDTANASVMFRTLHASYTGDVEVTIHFWE